MSNQKQLQFESSTVTGQTESALLKNYSRYKVEFVKGDGTYLYDSEGNKYLDFLSGIAVTSFGHSNQIILDAAANQLNNLWHVSNLFQSPQQELLAAKLAESSKLDYVFFCNSGTEANEAAIKFARKWGKGRSTIITAIGGFHGRTMGSLSASGQYKLWEGFAPLAPGFIYVPFDDVEAIENSISHDTVAIMVEPIQGESGVNVPSEGYLEKLKEICIKNNLLLILDEVQTGIGRTGKMFAYQWEDVKPDIVTSAKGIANGLPLGAVLTTKEVGEAITPGSHGSTFGGNPVAVSAANAVVDLLTDEKLNYVFLAGEKIKAQIKKINSPLIKEVRGKGLMIGVELIPEVKAKEIASKLLDSGVVAGTAGDYVLRILPPFIIDDEDIERFIKKLTDVLTNI